MVYIEEKGDLFKLEDNYVLVHCIAHDCRMGAGIAKEFNRRYPWIKPKVKEELEDLNFKPKCVYVIRNGIHVMNLITKEYSNGKPTIDSFTQAIEQLKLYCEYYSIKNIAMPTIGCGLDRLNWSIVSKIIQDTFKETDINIIVRYI